MPVKSDDPLRRVTLNLYEADCIELERVYGHGWTTYIRNMVHSSVPRSIPAPRPHRTLGDLE